MSAFYPTPSEGAKQKPRKHPMKWASSSSVPIRPARLVRRITSYRHLVVDRIALDRHVNRRDDRHVERGPDRSIMTVLR
jgi:hypothetical protein